MRVSEGKRLQSFRRTGGKLDASMHKRSMTHQSPEHLDWPLFQRELNEAKQNVGPTV
jgi:hypothetical protein